MCLLLMPPGSCLWGVPGSCLVQQDFLELVLSTSAGYSGRPARNVEVSLTRGGEGPPCESSDHPFPEALLPPAPSLSPGSLPDVCPASFFFQPPEQLDPVPPAGPESRGFPGSQTRCPVSPLKIQEGLVSADPLLTRKREKGGL